MLCSCAMATAVLVVSRALVKKEKNCEWPVFFGHSFAYDETWWSILEDQKYLLTSVIPVISLGWGRGPWLGNTTQSTKWTSWAAYTAVSCLTSPGWRQGFLVITTGPLRMCFFDLLNSPSWSGSLEVAEYCANTWRDISLRRNVRVRRQT